MSKTWEVLSSRAMLDLSPWLRVWQEHVRLPNGVEITDYVRVALRSWVAVFAVTAEGRVPIVEQHRHGLGASTLELPAGYLEDDEPPDVCARRELREEVGAEADSFEVLGHFSQMPERSDMMMHLLLARGARLIGAQALEPTEQIVVHWPTLAELRDLWSSGRVVNLPHSAAIARGLDAVGAL